ncbi:hypothetical protein [Nocardia panacis]|uniref:hypothetical protein n=1 Tax=Nocardia panacis TaxID=2340916 RepID=UPI0011C3B588|nr:hypothetical protein [Nocardia panacis]
MFQIVPLVASIGIVAVRVGGGLGAGNERAASVQVRLGDVIEMVALAAACRMPPIFGVCVHGRRSYCGGVVLM